ncbi:MAG TPA: DUF5681 domain-containing protein [Rhizomicrobium sp.]|jgi:hypothetical protein
MNDMTHDVGYKKPPRHSKWLKGHCGNPQRRYTRKPKTTAELIDGELSRSVAFTENGRRRATTVFEIICTQLATKVMMGGKGSRKAQHVYEAYKAFAAKQSGRAAYQIRLKDHESVSTKGGNEHG